MPVIFKTSPKVMPVRSRTANFNEAVKSLAPAINKLRAEKIDDIRTLAKCLNDAGVPAPNGGPFTYGTMRRVLVRLGKLHLGSPPRTLPTAAAARPSRRYKNRRYQRQRKCMDVLRNPSSAPK